jgi:hypothetical protein
MSLCVGPSSASAEQPDHGMRVALEVFEVLLTSAMIPAIVRRRIVIIPGLTLMILP